MSETEWVVFAVFYAAVSLTVALWWTYDEAKNRGGKIPLSAAIFAMAVWPLAIPVAIVAALFDWAHEKGKEARAKEAGR